MKSKKMTPAELEKREFEIANIIICASINKMILDDKGVKMAEQCRKKDKKSRLMWWLFEKEIEEIKKQTKLDKLQEIVCNINLLRMMLETNVKKDFLDYKKLKNRLVKSCKKDIKNS